MAGLGLAALLAVGSSQLAAQSATPASTDLSKMVAVVEGAKLRDAHPDAEKLRDLEKRVEELREEVREIPMRDVMDMRKKGVGTFRTALEQARAEMEAEKASINGEMAGLAAALNAKAQAEMNELKVEWERKLEGVMKASGAAPPSTPEDTAPVSLGEWEQNLKIMASRNVTARRLELEKASSNELAAERNRLDQQLAAYEDEVSLKYQDEKLNLQMRMQNGPTEEVEKATRERLNQIDDEIAAAKASKRQEVEASMEAFRNQKQASFEKELASYEANLMAELRSKAPNLADRPKRPTAAPQISAEAKAKVEQAQREMASAMAARKAEIEGQMSARGNEARARLEAKAKEVEGRLKELERQLQEDMERRSKNLSQKAKQQLEKAKAELKKAEADYKVVYDKVQADLAAAVGKIASKQNIPCVLGTYVVNVELEDLTDLSVVSVKQIGSP
jgi:hypothetical protein